MSGIKKFTSILIISVLALCLAGCGQKPVEGFAPDLSHWHESEKAGNLDANRYDLGFISRGSEYSCAMESKNNFSVPLTLVKGMQVGEETDFQYDENEKPCFVLSLWYTDVDSVMFYFFDDFKYVGYIDNNSDYNNPWDMPKYLLLNGEDMKLFFKNYRFYFTFNELDRVNEVVESFMQNYPDLLSAIVETDIAISNPKYQGTVNEEQYIPLDYSIFWSEYNFDCAFMEAGLENQLSGERYFVQKMQVKDKKKSYTYQFRVQELENGNYRLINILVDENN